ncbi:hypothetical protein TRSC58_07487 [Trypanosoma rangeli SC58]|uniref:Uncharacterized protein n=1 Tax=Trypanosoma rangeli SC58 TaxID=429131 RepID=A0A061IRL3_TRYRA|nr:hypothetical protein TRSC58_07487 [Trypanosoma rangeli SC58]
MHFFVVFPCAVYFFLFVCLGCRFHSYKILAFFFFNWFLRVCRRGILYFFLGHNARAHRLLPALSAEDPSEGGKREEWWGGTSGTPFECVLKGK